MIPYPLKNPHSESTWRTLLEDLQHHGFDRCFVAGGAVRDDDLGKLCKDIDVFVPFHVQPGAERSFVEFVDRVAVWAHKSMMAPTISRHFNKGYGDESDPTIAGAVTVRIPGVDADVQLIAVYCPPYGPWEIDSVLRRIDFGLCRAGYSNAEGVVLDYSYLQDRELQRFTILRCETWEQLRGSCRRWTRLFDKYPLPLFIDGFEIPKQLVWRIAEGDEQVLSIINHFGPPNNVGVRSLAARLGY